MENKAASLWRPVSFFSPILTSQQRTSKSLWFQTKDRAYCFVTSDLSTWTRSAALMTSCSCVFEVLCWQNHISLVEAWTTTTVLLFIASEGQLIHTKGCFRFPAKHKWGLENNWFWNHFVWAKGVWWFLSNTVPKRQEKIRIFETTIFDLRLIGMHIFLSLVQVFHNWAPNHDLQEILSGDLCDHLKKFVKGLAYVQYGFPDLWVA